MEKTFLLVRANDQPETLISLREICSVRKLKEQEIRIHLTDGSSHTITGELAEQIFFLLKQDAIVPDGNDARVGNVIPFRE